MTTFQSVFPKGNINKEILEEDLFKIASNHDGILDMICHGFVDKMSTTEVKSYQEMLNNNFPNQLDKVTTTDDGIKSLNFR